MTLKTQKEIDLAGSGAEVLFLVGSHHRITIQKLYGPAIVKDLKIVWEDGDWNVRNKIRQLKEEIKRLKKNLK